MKDLLLFARLLWRSARWQLVAALGLSTLLSLTEGVSLVMIFPILALLGVDGGGGAAAAHAGPRTRVLFHLLAASGIPERMWLGTVLVAVIVAVGVLTQLNGMLSTLTISIVLPVRRELASRIYAAILGADWAFLTRRKGSDLAHYLTAEMSRVGTLAASVMGVAANGMVAVLMLALAFAYAPLLTAVLLAALLLLVPLQRRAGRAIYRTGRETSLRMGEVFESSMERLGNLKVVKAYSAQEAELELFSRRYGDLIRELLRNEWQSVRSARWFQMASLVLLCGLILLGLDVLHMTAGSLLVFLFAFVRATPRINMVQSRGNEILADLPAFVRIQAFLAECDEHSERAGAGGGEDVPALARGVRLDDVRFRYAGDAPEVLRGVTMEFPAGSVTAIAGHSGAGKSTAADILLGLLEPESGSLEVDGVRVTRANALRWRRQIGYVSQDVHLFHDTVRANLRWALPGATDEQIAQALRSAHAEFVYDLPQGLETPVGDRGIMLSHGQRQRIALARALLLRPRLLILDEATNSLDLANEEAILGVVRGLEVTTILISHRPSAVRFADRVYVLDGGEARLEDPEDFADATDVRAAVVTSGPEGTS